MTTYADIVARRGERKTRTVRSHLTLDPSAFERYEDAKTAYSAALREDDKAATQQASDALDRAIEDCRDSGLFVHFRVPTAVEAEGLVAGIKTEGAEWSIDYLSALFEHATTIEGERVDDFDVAALRAELEASTTGVISEAVRAVNQAITSTDFPTPRRP